MDTETGEMIVKRVSVPIGLEELMEGLVKEVLLKKPDDIYLFAARYFAQLLNIRDKSQTPLSKTKTLRSVQTLKDKSEKLTSFRTSRLSKQFSVREDPSDTPIVANKPKMYHRNELKYKRRHTGPPITLEATRKDDIRKKYARSVSTEKHKPIIESNNRNKREKTDDSSKKTSNNNNNNKISNAAGKLLVPAKTRVKENVNTISKNSRNPLQDVRNNKKEDLSQKTSPTNEETIKEGSKEDSTNNYMQFEKCMDKMNNSSSIATDADVKSISPDEETKSASNEILSERSDNALEANQEISKSVETISMSNENPKPGNISKNNYVNKIKSSLTDESISKILISSLSNDCTNSDEKEDKKKILEVMDSVAIEKESGSEVLQSDIKETTDQQNAVSEEVEVKEGNDVIELSKHTVDVISDDSLELNEDLEDDVFIKEVEIIDTTSISTNLQKSNEMESNTKDATTISVETVEKDLESESAELKSVDELKNVGDDFLEIHKAKKEFEETITNNSLENVNDLVNIIEEEVDNRKVQNTIELECGSSDVTLNNSEEPDHVNLNEIKSVDSVSQDKNENTEKLGSENKEKSESNLKIVNINEALDSAKDIEKINITKAILTANGEDTIKEKEITNDIATTENDSSLDADKKQNLEILGGANDNQNQPKNKIQIEPQDKTNQLIEVENVSNDLDKTVASTKILAENINENEPSHGLLKVEEAIIKKELTEQNKNIDNKLASNITVKDDEIKTDMEVTDDINVNSNVTESEAISENTIKLENEILSPVSQIVIGNKIEVANENVEDGNIVAGHSIEKLDHSGENDNGTIETTKVNKNKSDSNEFEGSSKNTSVCDTPKNETYTIDDFKNSKSNSVSQNTSTDGNGLYVDEHISSGSSSARDDVIEVQVDNKRSRDINTAETPKSVEEENDKTKILKTVRIADVKNTEDNTKIIGIVTMDRKEESLCSEVNDSVEVAVEQNHDNKDLTENKTKLAVEENEEERIIVERNSSNQDEHATNLNDEAEIVLDVTSENEFSGKVDVNQTEDKPSESNTDGDKDMSINIIESINKEVDKTGDGKSNESSETDLVDRVAKNYVNYIIDNDRIMQLHSNSSGEDMDNGDRLDISHNTTSEVKDHIDADKYSNPVHSLEELTQKNNGINMVKSESGGLDKSDARKEEDANIKEPEVIETTAKTEIDNNTSSTLKTDCETTQDIRKDQKVILETGNIERIDTIVKTVTRNSEPLNSNVNIPSFSSARLREELEKVEQVQTQNKNTVSKFEAEKTEDDNQVEKIATDSLIQTSNTTSTTKPIKDNGEIEFTQASKKQSMSKDLIEATLSISESGLIANQVKHFLNDFIKSEQQHVDKFDVDNRDIGNINGLIKTKSNDTSNAQPSNVIKRAMSFDSLKLREELKKAEEESKFTSFKSSYNPFLLHKEIEQAAKIKISDRSTSNQVDTKPSEEADFSELEKTIKAVLKIQSFWRGFKTRKITKEINYNNLPKTTVNGTGNSNKNDDSVKIDNKNFQSDSIDLEKLLKAVLRIQATWRGFKARKKVKNTDKLNAEVAENEGKSANEPDHIKIDEVSNISVSNDTVGEQFTSLSSDSAELKKILASVVNIQAMWRGHQIRKNMKTKNHVNKKDEVSHKINDQNQFKDPSVVEDSWRKKRETLTNQDFLTEVYAAIIIQKLWRGFKTRRTLKGNGSSTMENSDRKTLPMKSSIKKTEVETKETVGNVNQKLKPEEKEDTVRVGETESTENYMENKGKKTYFSEDSSDSVKTVIHNDAYNTSTSRFPLFHSGNIDPFLDEILDYPIMKEENLLDDYQSKLLDKISGKEDEAYNDLNSLEKIISPKGIDHINLDALKAEDLLHGSVLSKVDRDRKLTRSMGSKLEILEEEGSNTEEDKNETEKADSNVGTNISKKNNGVTRKKTEGVYKMEENINGQNMLDANINSNDIVEMKRIEDDVSNKNGSDFHMKSNINEQNENSKEAKQENADKAKADNTKAYDGVTLVEKKISNVECENDVSNLIPTNLKSEQSVEFDMNGTKTKKDSSDSSITETINKVGLSFENIKEKGGETIDDTTPNDIKVLENTNKEKNEMREGKAVTTSLDINTNSNIQKDRSEASINTYTLDQKFLGNNEGQLNYQSDDDKNNKDVISTPISIQTNGEGNKEINEYIGKESKSELKSSDLKSDMNAQDDKMKTNNVETKNINMELTANEQNNINDSPPNSNVDTTLRLCEEKDEKNVPVVGTDFTNKLKSEKSTDEKLYTFCSVPTPISANNKVNENSLPPDVELLPSTSDRSDTDGRKYRKPPTETPDSETDHKVLKTGTLVIPLPIAVQETLKGEQKSTNTIVEDLKKSTSLEGVSSVLSNAGMNSGELHDTVIVPVNNHQRIDIGRSQPIAVQLCQTSGQVYLIIILSLASDIQQDAENVTSQHPRSRLDVNDVSMDADVEQNNAQNPGKDDLQQPKAEGDRSIDNSISQRESMESEKRRKIDRGRNMEAEAATKIQAGFRGYQVRKQLKLKNGSSDMNTRKSSSKSKTTGADSTRSGLQNSSPDIEELSAVKIQAGIRGFLVRRRQKKQSHQA